MHKGSKSYFAIDPARHTRIVMAQAIIPRDIPRLGAFFPQIPSKFGEKRTQAGRQAEPRAYLNNSSLSTIYVHLQTPNTSLTYTPRRSLISTVSKGPMRMPYPRNYCLQRQEISTSFYFGCHSVAANHGRALVLSPSAYFRRNNNGLI